MKALLNDLRKKYFDTEAGRTQFELLSSDLSGESFSLPQNDLIEKIEVAIDDPHVQVLEGWYKGFRELKEGI
jgi:hypothetical protein